MHCVHTAHKQVHLRLCAAVFAEKKDPTSLVIGITYKPQAADRWLCPCSWGWWPAVNYPTPCSCPGMKWDIKTHQLYRWLDSQQHNMSRCTVFCDLFNLSFTYFYVKHKHSYIDLFDYVPIYVLRVKIILMKVVSWGQIPLPISLKYVIQYTHWTQDLLHPLLMQMPSLC